MTEKHRYAYISATSNTVVKTGSGILHGITGTFPSGASIRIDDTHRFGQGVLDINAVSSNTVAFIGANSPGMAIGFDSGLAVAVSSNAKLTVEYQ